MDQSALNDLGGRKKHLESVKKVKTFFKKPSSAPSSQGFFCLVTFFLAEFRNTKALLKVFCGVEWLYLGIQNLNF